MNFSSLENVLWAASLVGHMTLVFVMVWKSRVRQFPIFTISLSFEAVTTVLLFLISRFAGRHAYIVAYWSTGVPDYLLQIAILFEVARDVLRPTGSWVRDARRSFFLWGGFGLVVAAALAMLLGPPEARGLGLWEARVTVFTSMLTCELFIAMAAAANRLGLQWRSRVFAVGQGLAIWAFSSLLEDFAHAALGWNQQFEIFDQLRMVVYLLVLGYWAVTFWLPERARAPLSTGMQEYLLALHKRVQYDLSSVDGQP